MKVLLADDHVDTVETLATFLRLHGHEVHTVKTGEEAVMLAAAVRPDAALLDILMPNGDGFEAAAKIRALVPGVLLIAVTGCAPKSKDVLTVFDQYLLKPAGAQYLLALLAQYQPTKR
jgi:two-component system, chemotaxis family, CheB/CheR fusion protein